MNVHPEHIRERRRARTKYPIEQYSGDPRMRYVDVTDYGKTRYAAVTINARTREVSTSASMRCVNATEAEETALALAMAEPWCETVLSDLLEDIRNLANGRISDKAAKIIERVVAQEERRVEVRWIPAYAGEYTQPQRDDPQGGARYYSPRSQCRESSRVRMVVGDQGPSERLWRNTQEHAAFETGVPAATWVAGSRGSGVAKKTPDSVGHITGSVTSDVPGRIPRGPVQCVQEGTGHPVARYVGLCHRTGQCQFREVSSETSRSHGVSQQDR